LPQALVSAIDADKSGDISREEFDKGFSLIVSGLVRRGLYTSTLN
jgi:hypothetical protein